MTHVAFIGVTVDHLYPDCPSLTNVTRRVVLHIEDDGLWGRRVGDPCPGEIDPLGSDVCGLCLIRWKRRGGTMSDLAGKVVWYCGKAGQSTSYDMSSEGKGAYCRYAISIWDIRHLRSKYGCGWYELTAMKEEQ